MSFVTAVSCLQELDYETLFLKIQHTLVIGNSSLVGTDQKASSLLVTMKFVGGENLQQYYPAANVVNYNNDQHDKICPPIQ